MLVVVAGRHDREARHLEERWAPMGTAILTCDDLSVAGWRHPLENPEDSVAVIGGQVVAAREITGVLTRLPYVPEHELRRIAREERAFVAAEMTAFLRSWLAGLRCPVLNRPTPTCLTGPGWRRERWAYAAARLGVPVQPVEWHLDRGTNVPEEDGPAPSHTVTVVGARCLETADGELASQARRLAAAGGVDLLAVHFAETEAGLVLHGADTWADVSSPEVADAILEHLNEG